MSTDTRRGEHLIFPETAERVRGWREDPAVLGVLLVGSKSHEHHDDLSDDDLEVVLSDNAYSRLNPVDCIEVYVQGEGAQRKLIYDAQFVSFPQISAKATSPFDLDHWPYERARVLFDRGGRLLPLVEKLAQLEPEFRRQRLTHATIDAWIAIYRAEKTARRGEAASARVLRVRSARAVARLLFALESRWVPLDHWLAAELKTLPARNGAAAMLVRGLEEDDVSLLKTVLDSLEDDLFAEGVPRPVGRRDLFLELIHPTRSAERAVHGLV